MRQSDVATNRPFVQSSTRLIHRKFDAKRKQNAVKLLNIKHGKPACVHIDIGSGVCGAAAASLETQRVADVHQFEGHIACDADSRSEVVVPLICNGELIGVLDIDSPSPDRFSAVDQKGVENLCASFCELQGLRDDLKMKALALPSALDDLKKSSLAFADAIDSYAKGLQYLMTGLKYEKNRQKRELIKNMVCFL